MIVGIVIGSILALTGLLVILGTKAKQRELAARPHRGCAEAVPGEVARFEGHANIAEPLRAPLSGVPCVHHRHKIVGRRRRGFGDRHRHRRPEVVLGRCEVAGDWWLEDESGSVWVESDGARLVGERRSYGYSQEDMVPGLSGAIEDLLHKAGLDDHRDEELTVIETVIPVGTRVHVRGPAEDRGDGVVLTGRGDLLVSRESEQELAKNEISGVLIGAALILVGVSLALTVIAPRFDDPPVPPPKASPLQPLGR